VLYTLDLNFVNDRRSVVCVRIKRACTTIVSEGGTLYTATIVVVDLSAFQNPLVVYVLLYYREKKKKNHNFRVPSAGHHLNRYITMQIARHYTHTHTHTHTCTHKKIYIRKPEQRK